MNRTMAFLLGMWETELCGAEPQSCVNALTEAGIPFWHLRCVDALHYRLCVPWYAGKKLAPIALRCNCTVSVLRASGMPLFVRRLRKRPCFVLFFLLSLAASFFLQRFVWTIEVEGNDTFPAEYILQALEEEGIHVGARSDRIDANLLRMRMVNRIPELSWLTVNRSGGKLRVLLTERMQQDAQTPACTVGHIVASRDGVITDYAILEGMKLCSRGQTVKAGQVLVSGNEDYGLFIRRVCAEGEIYANTWHSGTIAMSRYRQEKRETGRVWERLSLRVGRKRIFLFGNSSNLPTGCDKITVVKEATLPGYRFPLSLEREIWREYETVPVEIPEQEARTLLIEAWQRQLQSRMIAGSVLQNEYRFRVSGGLYLLEADSSCNEMIGRLLPVEEEPGGENNE